MSNLQFHYVPSEEGKVVRLKNTGERRALTGLRALVETAKGLAYQIAKAAIPTLDNNIESEAQVLAQEFKDVGWDYEAAELERVARDEGIW